MLGEPPRADHKDHLHEPVIEHRRNVGIFSLIGPDQHGGLESYIRMLTKELTRNTYCVSWNGGSPVETVSLAEAWRPRVSRLLPIMTRPQVRFLSRSVAQWQGLTWCKNAVKNCDIVHFVGTGWDLVGFPLIRAAHDQQKKVTCWPAVHPREWGDAPLDIDLYQKMDTVFVQSDYEGEHLRELGVPESVLFRCGCAATDDYPGDADRFRQKYDLANRKLVLFIGRKSHAKGYHSLRDAIAALNRRGMLVTLVSIGRGLEPPSSPLPGEIELDLGAADDATKHDALAACNVFALPSKAESFGIVYVEAWAYGKPVICGAAPASRELVKRHSGGITTDGTAGEVSQAIANLLSSPGEAEAYGRSGLKAVCAEYTAKRVFQRHLDVWNQGVSVKRE